MPELNPTCPKCGSTNVYYRTGGWKFSKGPKGYRCRHCGNQFPGEQDSLHGTVVDKKHKRG